MDHRETFRRAYRQAGFFEGGQTTDLDGTVNSRGRSFDREGVPLASSESSSEGDQSFLLVGQGGLPAPCGYWPFLL